VAFGGARGWGAAAGEAGAADVTHARSTATARWIAVVSWAAVIFVASTGWFADSRTASALRPLLAWLVPGAGPETVDAVNTVARKLGHFVEYAVLGWLIARALHDARGRQMSHAVLAVALATAYAVTDELHQHFVLGRSAAVGDVGIDLLGAVAAQVANALWWGRRRHARRAAR
jgi:VanZ family protein